LGNVVIELLRTNDLVLISSVTALLEAASIESFTLDRYVSGIEGSIGAFPQRVLVHAEDAPAARRLLIEAGLGHELRAMDGR
jgi:hypothetical protein